MKILPVGLPGVFRIDIDVQSDSRGLFARTWCSQEMGDAGLANAIDQCSVSVSDRRGTLRGFHFQVAPFEETKIVRCTRGSILDVVVDVRPSSPAYLQKFEMVLSAENHAALYIPKGFAHAFQTLEDETEVLYMMSGTYEPGAARTIRYDDPRIGVRWPVEAPIISEKDLCAPLSKELMGE